MAFLFATVFGIARSSDAESEDQLFRRRKSECIAPPIADDPEATKRLRDECESKLRKTIKKDVREDELGKMREALCRKSEPAPDLACNKDQLLPKIFEGLCIEDCKARLPTALHRHISGCSAATICGSPPSDEFMKELALACGAGAASQGQKKWNDLPALVELPKKAYEIAQTVHDFRFPDPKATSAISFEAAKHVLRPGSSGAVAHLRS